MVASAANKTAVETYKEIYPHLSTDALLRSVVQGDELAQHEWGSRLALGSGGAPFNQSAAAMWYSRAAQRGTPGSASLSSLPNAPIRIDRTQANRSAESPPVAHLAEPTESLYALTRMLDGSVSNGSSTIIQYIWDAWSDTNPVDNTLITDLGAGQAQVTFPTYGTWYVRLIVLDAAGLIDHITQVHTVLEPLPSPPAVPTLSAPASDSIIQSSVPVNFSWLQSAAADSYDLEIFTKAIDPEDTDPEAAYTVLAAQNILDQDCPTTGCSVSSIINANAGSGIFWRVRANNSDGSSDWIESRVLIVAEATSTPALPEVVSPVEHADVNREAITEFVWEHEEQAETYEFFFFNNQPDGQVSPIVTGLRAYDICETGVCSYTASVDLPAFEQHIWRVRAINSLGASDWTQTYFNVVEPVSEPPASPVLVTPHSQSVIEEGQSIEFSWIKALSASTYEIQIVDSSNPSLEAPNLLIREQDCEADTCSTNIAIELPLAETYEWQVRAINAAGASPFASSVFSVIAAIVEPPVNVITLSPESTSQTLVGASQTFSWEGNYPDSSVWRVVIGSEPGLSDIAQSGDLESVSTWTVDNLPTDGQTIYVRLFGYNGTEWIAYDFSYIAGIAVSEPLMLSPVSDQPLNDASQIFSWDDNNSGSTAWRVVIGTEPGLTDIAESGDLGASTTWTVDNLPTDGQEIYVRLFAYRDGEWMPHDFVFTATTEVIYPEVLDNPLIQMANMVYEGAFIIESTQFGYSRMFDAEGGMAYAPPKPLAPNGSIFASGNFANGGVSEWAIPQLSKSDNINLLNLVEQPLQEFVDISHRAEHERVPMGYFADLLWLDNQLVYSEHNYYPASNLELHKMGVLRDASNLQDSVAGGYFRVNTLSGEEPENSYTAESASGWMSEVPEEWQSVLEGTHLLGPADGWNIEGRFAAGPSVFAFNPQVDALNKEPDSILGSSVLVDYATENPLRTIGIVGDPYVNAPSDLWNSMSFVHFGFIPEGSRTLMLVGKQWGIDDDIGYKIVQDNGQLCAGPCPFKSDDHDNYYWLIDLQDVYDAKNGLRRYDSIVPYAYGVLPLPFQLDSEGNDSVNDLKGGAYDADTGTVYLQIRSADRRPTFEHRPVVAAYSFDIDTEYEVPTKPVWTSVAGTTLDSEEAVQLTVSCEECSSGLVEVYWSMPTVGTTDKSIVIDHYRLHFENLDLDYYNAKRHQRIGVSVAGNETSHVQELSPGNWRVTIRAISSDSVPSEPNLF